MAVLTRRDFLAMASMLGMGSLLGACGDGPRSGDHRVEASPATPSERVLIIGAGAAGMAAGHLLAQRGVDFSILEAAPTHGGRVKTVHDFVDFPIPLGAEFLHAPQSTLAQIVNDESVVISQRMQGYDASDPVAGVVDTELIHDTLGSGYDDLKFVGGTWLDFFDAYVVPGIEERMVFDTQIVAIDHSGDRVLLADASGTDWEADRLILTVPMKILQDGDIEFTPGLPAGHVEALQRATIWTGMKVFLEFSEAFYPAFVDVEEEVDGQRVYYDAAYGQDSEANVLGLFVVGPPARPYQELDPGDELRDHVLTELDLLFDGAASRSYVQHVAQDWQKEPFIRAAYLADTADEDISRILGRNIGPRVFMAGCGYTREDDWSSIHTAVRSARDAVGEMYR